MYEQQPYNPYRNNIAIIKDFFKSPMVLALAITHIVSMIISVVTSILSAAASKDIMRQISVYIDKNLVLQNADSDVGNQLVKGIRDALASDSTTTISIPVFTILTVIGLILLYVGSRNTNPDSAPTAGVTILNVIAILALVGYIILAVGMMIIAVALFIVYATFQAHPSRAFTVRLGADRLQIDATVLLILAIAFTVFAVICSFIMLFYVGSRKRFIGSVKKSLTSVELSNKGAKPFGVFSVIIAVFSIISLIGSIGSLFTGELQNEMLSKIGVTLPKGSIVISILSIVSQAVAVVVAILEAKLALGYAKYIDEKRGGFSTPTDAAGGFAPINAGVGVNSQPTPYSYLAQPKTEQPVKDDSFVNPYIAKDEQTAAPTCPNCGSPVDSKAPFCGHCGTKL
ncbi:MAG: zinc-ribbon domain-containing protein [Ruminococcus sp.]|nr:zinc-ribbon domain-containing protein [Ruminococcus sp.]